MNLTENRKFVLILLSGFLAIFLGAFLALYLVLGQILPTKFYSSYALAEESFSSQEKIISDMNKHFDEMRKEFDSFFDESRFSSGMFQLGNINLKKENATVNTEENPTEYIITIDLKPFNNDEKNINLDIKENKIIINAKYESKDKNNYNSAIFYQSLNLPEKIDDSKIKKEVKDNHLIITIPKLSEKKSGSQITPPLKH